MAIAAGAKTTASDEAAGPPRPTCRVAIVGAGRQRVARIVALLLRADDDDNDDGRSRGSVVATASLVRSPNPPRETMTSEEEAEIKTTTLLPTTTGLLVPSSVRIEYLPCVATFDSYYEEDDERGSGGESVRYLAKLEYHGPNGTLVRGKSLAPFFDEVVDTGTGENDENDDSEGDGGGENPFPGIAAVAIGCGIDSEDDVSKIRNLLETLSSSLCASQVSSKQTGDGRGQGGMLIECIQPNAEYASMKDENEAFRLLSEDEKREAVAHGTIGPGKMANFAHDVAKRAIRQRWDKELTEFEKSLRVEEERKDQISSSDDRVTGEQSGPQSAVIGETETMPEEEEQSTPEIHVPDPEKTRYACKRCRTVLFGTDDLEDPPHAQSLHDFRKWGGGSKSGYYGNNNGGGGGAPCQNHCLSEPLPWMEDGCAGVEGKLHCPKCKTKVGHYSWTGAQCSCGTWVTPAIMVPVSRVDEMRPISHNVIAASGALFVDRSGLMGAPSVQPPVELGMNHEFRVLTEHMGGMTIAGEGASRLENVKST